jgi:hypothetical protein
MFRMDENLPPGLTFDPPPQALAPETEAPAPSPRPPGMEPKPAAPPPLPPGLSFDAPPPPNALPAGLSFDPPKAEPEKRGPVDDQKMDEGISGFWKGLVGKMAGDDPIAQRYLETLTRPYQNIAGTALAKGAVESTEATIDASKVAVSPNKRQTLEDVYKERQAKKAAEDEIDKLNAQTISQGATDWRWWVTKLAHATGSSAPMLAGGLAGAPLGPAGVAAGTAATAGMASLVPAYEQARLKGLSEDDAIQQALIDTGIATTFGAAMGVAPAIAVTGKVAVEAPNGAVINLLKSPVKEALVQLGIIQPTLGAAQGVVTTASHGEIPTVDQTLTDFVIGFGQGAAIHSTHVAASKVREGAISAMAKTEPSVPASPEDVQRAFQAQQGPSAGAGSEQFDQPIHPIATPQEQIFYSAVKRSVENLPEGEIDPKRALNLISRGEYVKQSELEALELPSYLAGANGKVSKRDLLAHIEERQVDLIESVRQDDAQFEVDRLYDRNVATYGSVGKWPKAVHEHFENVRAAAEARALETKALQFGAQTNFLPGEYANPREFIFKTPEPVRDPMQVEDMARSMWEYNYASKYGPWERADEQSRENARKSAVEALHQKDPNVFTGSHWSDPNAFAHARVSERTDRDGRRMLHVEEVQSDVHQMGAKKGYRPKEAPSLTSDEAEALVNRARQRYEKEKAGLERFGLDVHDDPLLQKLKQEWNKAMDIFREVNELHGKVANLPFKTEWQELVVKRLMRLAADEGYDGISWSNGDQVGLRLKADPENPGRELNGARTNYDKKLKSIFERWAKKLGGTVESTKFGDNLIEGYQNIIPKLRWEARKAQFEQMGVDFDKVNGGNNWIRITPDVSTNIRKGFPLYEEDVKPAGQPRGTKTLSDLVRENKLAAKLAPAARKIDLIVRKLANELKVSRGITINAINDPSILWRGRKRGEFEPATGNYIIDVNLARIFTKEDLYAAMSHEFGHIVEHNLFLTASNEQKAAIIKAFSDYRKSLPSGDISVGDVRRLRDNAVSQVTGAREEHNFYRLSELEPSSRAYLLSREEWFAEQVAKWMQTDQRPLGIVEKFFKTLATKVKKAINTFAKASGRALAEPDAAVRDFLNERYDARTPWTEPIQEQFEQETKKANQEAMAKDGTPESQAVPMQASTVGGRNIIASLPPDGTSSAAAMAAHADRMNWFYDLALSLPQIQELNPHIVGLRTYHDIVRVMNEMRNQLGKAAQDRLRQWNSIKDKVQLKNLTNFIQDYANGMFKLPHTEDGVFRRPNQEEFAALVKKHELSAQSIKLFEGITKDFDGFLERYRAQLIEDAQRIKDPTRRATALANINTRIDGVLSRPFMPLTRFGKYSITVYDAKGKIRHYEQTNSLRRQAQIHDALEKSTDRLPGDRVSSGEVPKDATPFLGMPPGLIDVLAQKLNLSESQKSIVDQLRFDYAPAQSFKHQFRNLDLVPGYDTDFMRSYAHFFFHGANHLARVKWVDALRDQVALTSKDRLLMRNSNKRDQIVRFMQTHLDSIIDPKNDWAGFKGLMFHWYLGFNPASALTNLTQTPLMTYPHLAAAFGDARAMAYIAKAGLELNNFYKKATISEAAKGAPPGPAGARERALGRAVEDGTISETQAHQLASISEDRNLLRHFGREGEQAWIKFQDASSWMFETTEQYNRRVAFRAAWDMSMRDTNRKYVRDAVRDAPVQYRELTKELGWSDQEASAYIAAKQAVEKTQYVYAPYARPKFMQGKAGSIFVFKMFTQNTLFNLAAHPSQFARWMLVMGMLGGLQGMVGWDDISSILKTIAYRLFGKDFDLEKTTRKFLKDVTSGAISPDIMMHGLSSQGFGIPAVLNSVGTMMGRDKPFFPTPDMSGGIQMGQTLGFDPMKLSGLYPSKEREKMQLREAWRALGAGAGPIKGIFDAAAAATDGDMGKLKMWEQVMPKFLGNISKSIRYGVEGKETNPTGNAVVKFDVNDTEQMGEILAQAMGLRPRRLAEEQERRAATREAGEFWDLRKALLLRQFGDAVKNKSQEEKESVLEAIRNYNKSLPKEAGMKAITSEVLKQSVMNRLKVQGKQEAGLPTAKSDIPIAKDIEQYYPRGWPQGQVGAKPVR